MLSKPSKQIKKKIKIDYFSASRIICDEEHEMFPLRSGRAGGCGCVHAFAFQASPNRRSQMGPGLSLPPPGAPRNGAVLWGCVPLLSTSQQQHCAELRLLALACSTGGLSAAGLCLLCLLCAT